MTGFRQQSLNEGILNGSRVSNRLVAIQISIKNFKNKQGIGVIAGHRGQVLHLRTSFSVTVI
jgi:hypothetical protein